MKLGPPARRTAIFLMAFHPLTLTLSPMGKRECHATASSLCWTNSAASAY